MKAYHNSAVLQFDDSTTGNAGAGVPVTVRLNSTQALVSIFDLDEVAIANPTTTDSKGNYAFKTTDGVYDIIISEGTSDEVVLEKVQISEFLGLINDLSQAYEFATLDAAVNSLITFPVGKVIHLKERTAGDGGGATWDVVLASTVIPNTYNIVQCVGNITLALVLRVVTANALQFGASTDGITDSSSVYAEMFTSGSKTIVFPQGAYRGKISVDSIADFDIIFEEGATLKSFTTDQVVAISNSSNVTLSGGEFETPERVTRPIAITSCSKVAVKNVKVSFETKSTYSGSAIYSTAAIYMQDCNRCIVDGNEVFNMEGFGIACTGIGSGNIFRMNYIHDNIGGILNNGNTNNFNTFIENDIGFNNVSSGSGNDGILINGTSIDIASSGHLISNNRIYNNGEHGMYVQCGNTIISDNRVYSNAEGGIKVSKCRKISIIDNICFSNQSNIQVQSGYEHVLVQGNNCEGATTFDLGFTWSLALDAFGGKDVKVIGNYFHSDTVPNWAIAADGSEGIIIENNSCTKGIIYTSNATPVDYSNIRIVNNQFIDGMIKIARCDDAVISRNRAKDLSVNSTNGRTILEDNHFTNIAPTVRKDIPLSAFSSIRGNKIVSSLPSGAPVYELFNGQDSITDKLRFCDNDIQTQGALIFNISSVGGLTNSTISNNIFDANGSVSGNVLVGASASTIMGNTGLLGSLVLPNCVAVGNIGGATYSGTGGSFSNNI